MAETRHAQFCALARAAEVLGERWTLLIVRELLLGPKRFTDLRGRLDVVSTSVLAQRLARLEQGGVVRRGYLPPPAASNVYELTDDGRALAPAVFELIRWGARRLLPPRPGERMEPDWLRLALAACARRDPSPPLGFTLRITDDAELVLLHIAGGQNGTSVRDGDGPAAATITADPRRMLALVSGLTPAVEAVAAGDVAVDGDIGAVSLLPAMFDIHLEGVG